MDNENEPRPGERPDGKKRKTGLIVLAAAAAVCIAAVIVIVCASRGRTVEPSGQIVIETAAPTEVPASAGDEASDEASDETAAETAEPEAEEVSDSDTAAIERPVTDSNAAAAAEQEGSLPESTSDSDIGYYESAPASD